MQLNKGIELIRFYDNSDQLLASWGIPESDTHEGVMLDWIREVNAREHPISPLNCQKKCTQFAVAPLLVEGKSVGVVVIGAPLIDAILGFKNISGADIGLLIKEHDDVIEEYRDENPNGKFGLPHSPIANEYRPILITWLSNTPISEPGARGAGFWDNRYQQLKLFALERIDPSDKAQFIVITDTTSTVHTIQNSTQQNMIIGAVGLMLSEILLFVILTKPLSRLKHIVFTLPLLARSSFQDFRASLRYSRPETMAEG